MRKANFRLLKENLIRISCRKKILLQSLNKNSFDLDFPNNIKCRLKWNQEFFLWRFWFLCWLYRRFFFRFFRKFLHLLKVHKFLDNLLGFRNRRIRLSCSTRLFWWCSGKTRRIWCFWTSPWKFCFLFRRRSCNSILFVSIFARNSWSSKTNRSKKLGRFWKEHKTKILLNSLNFPCF